MQDAARTQLRRKARRQERAGLSERYGRYSWKQRLYDAYDAGQAWIVVTLVGMGMRCFALGADWKGIAIGLNAAFLNIATEWLSDIKLGYCTTAFYLNENFCCSGAESGMPTLRSLVLLTSKGCPEFKRWTGFWPFNYALYITFAVSRPANH